MIVTAPHYYKEFQCIAGECPDTCCAGWEIAIDPKSLKKYRERKGPLETGFITVLTGNGEFFISTATAAPF